MLCFQKTADILGETPNITTSRQAGGVGVGVGWGYVVVPVSQDDSSGKRAPRSALTLLRTALRCAGTRAAVMPRQISEF